MIKEIGKYIEAETTFAVGTDLFVGHRPVTAPDECIVVLEGGGGFANFNMTDKVTKAVQVLSRAASYHTARNNCYTVFNALHGKAWVELPVVTTGVNYIAMAIEGVSIPASIGQDERGLYEFSVNFVFRVKDK